jgi:hypothetical protein
MNERRRQTAALNINRVVRGFLGRRRTAYLRGIYQKRMADEKARENARQAKIQLIGASLAIKLQRVLRHKVYLRKRRELNAAKKIQARVR